MSRRSKKRQQKQVGNQQSGAIQTAQDLAVRLRSLPRGPGSVREPGGLTSPPVVPIGQGSRGAEDTGPKSDGTNYWKAKYEEGRFEGIEQRIEAQYTTSIATFKDEVRKEIHAYKDETIKWAIGIIVCSIIAVILALVIYHFAAVAVMKRQVSDSVSEQIRGEIRGQADEIDALKLKTGDALLSMEKLAKGFADLKQEVSGRSTTPEPQPVGGADPCTSGGTP